MTGSPIIFPNLRNPRNPSSSNYHMSINNCQAIQNSCIDRKSNAWSTLGSESETFGSRFLRGGHGFQLLNDRQREFGELSGPIMYKLSYNMSTEKFQSIRNIFLYHKYETTRVVTSYLFPVKRDAYSWREIGSTH